MALVHVDVYAVDFELYIMVALAIEAEDVAHPRATTSLGTHAQVVAIRDVLAAHDVADLIGGATSEGHRSGALHRSFRAIFYCNRTHSLGKALVRCVVQ